MNNYFKTEKVYAGPEPIEKETDEKPDNGTGAEKIVQAPAPYPANNADAKNQKFMAVYAGPDMSDQLKVREPNSSDPVIGFNGTVFEKGMETVTPDTQPVVTQDLGVCPNCGEKRECPSKFCVYCGFSFPKQ